LSSIFRFSWPGLDYKGKGVPAGAQRFRYLDQCGKREIKDNPNKSFQLYPYRDIAMYGFLTGERKNKMYINVN
jgi:hypothetical protein